MADIDSKTPLRLGTPEGEDYADPYSEYEKPQTQRTKRWLSWPIAAVLGISLLCNVFQAWQNYKAPSTSNALPSQYAGLKQDATRTFEYNTEWWGENKTKAEELWDSIDTSYIAIAPSREWTDAQGLQRPGDFTGARFPWDQERGLYFVKAFHQLHCLKIMRRAFVDLTDGRPAVISAEHIHHCLDSLRQDVECLADDTPMPVLTPFKIGDQQTRQCRDIAQLRAWAAAPERNACHRTLDDYKTAVHPVERFQYCPADSPFVAQKERYFAKFGHKSPWGDDDGDL